MGQHWVIVDVDERTYEEIHFKLGECFWSTQIIPESLMVPIWPKERLWTMTEDLVALRARDSTAPILKLPIELLNKIVGYVNTSADAVAFCITHPILGVVGEDRLRKTYERDNGSRAGHRLITLGGWAEVNDLPNSVQADLKHDLDLFNERRAAGQASDRPKYDDMLPSRCVTEVPYTRYEDKGYGSIYWCGEGKLAASTRDWDELKRVKKFILSSYPRASLYKEDSDLVLCNLSEGTYVRNDAIRRLYTRLSKTEPKIMDDLDLGTVVLAYNCWSSDSSSAMSLVSEDITRGPWAGDRFEIRPYATMRADVDWEDVTDEAVAWLNELYEAERAN